MSKKVLIPLVIVILILVAGLVWLFINLQEQKQVNQDMQELAELESVCHFEKPCLHWRIYPF